MNKSALYFKLCSKCGGHMYFDSDNDLHCLMCGHTLVMQVRRQYDSRKGKIRDNKKKSRRGYMDWDSELANSGTRNSSSPNHDSTLARQRGLGSGTRNPLSRR